MLGMYGIWSVWYDGVAAEHGRCGSMEDWSEQC